MALGAFLAGLVVGRSDYSLRAASEALPMRDAFAVLFFVAVGMLLSPGYLLEAPGLILATLAVVMIGKPLIALVIVRLLGYPFKVALSIAVALSQIGEFSFILSSLGRELNILPPEATNTLVAASIVSIVFNPILYRAVPHIDRWAAAHPRLRKLLNPPLREGATGAAVERKVDPSRRAVVIGYGPTGRTVVRLLRDNGIVPAVIELNMDTVRRLREHGIDAVYGDATKRDTLEAAHASTRRHGDSDVRGDGRRCRGDSHGSRAQSEGSGAGPGSVSSRSRRDAESRSRSRLHRRRRGRPWLDRNDSRTARRDSRTNRSRT